MYLSRWRGYSLLFMQYKIPVHIENEDKIFLNLSIRQMVIIMIFWGIGYAIFKSLEPQVGGGIALFPGGAVAFIGVVIALFKHSEMTFLPFVFNLLRSNINAGSRTWGRWTDSYPNLEIGYVRPIDAISEKKVISKTSQEAFDSVEDKLKHL